MSPASQPPILPIDVGGISGWLDSLACLVERLVPSSPVEDLANTPLPVIPDYGSVVPTTDVPSMESTSPRLLSTMSQDDVFQLIHHEGAVLPSVRPCDTANSSNKKTHWSAEELHHTMG
jgi:hypothetical protein